VTDIQVPALPQSLDQNEEVSSCVCSTRGVLMCACVEASENALLA